MDNKPSYDSLKAVLRGMEANKRLKLVAACPSLRNVDKAVPFTIQHLTFYSNYSVRINDKLYNLGIIREYRDGNPTETIKTANDEGGVRCDLDEWGFERPNIGLVKSPGDLVFGNVPEHYEEVYDEESKRRHEAGIEGYKARYSKAVADEIEDLYDTWIDEHETALLPYRCRETNTKPAHDCFVQLSLEPAKYGESFIPIGRAPYTKKLYEYMNSFMKFIFGGRRHAVEVKCLEFCDDQIIRLPEGVNFKVHGLKTTQTLDAVSSVISTISDESCMPIKHISVYMLNEMEHPLVKNAEEITFLSLDLEQNLFEFLQNLPHLKVNFLCQFQRFDTEELIDFIKNVLTSDEKKIGKTYRLGFGEKNKMIESFEEIGRQLKDMARIDLENKRLILQMNNSNEMHISYRTNIVKRSVEPIVATNALVIEIVKRNELEDK